MPPTRKTSLEKKLANATVTPDEIYKYLTIDKGLSHEHAMGMLPNIVEESEFIYNRIQSDAKYDPDHSKGRQGIGLFQYTEPTRRKNFVEAVPDWQTNWKGQIDFALSEPETKKYLNQSFDTLEDASRYFTTDWERPKNRFKQAEKRLEYVPDLLTQIEAQNTKPYASETFQSYVMPTVNVIEQDPIKEYIDLNSDNTINDLLLAGQQMNYFDNGGGKLEKDYTSVDSKRILFDPNYVTPSESKTFYDRLVDKGQKNSVLENLYEFFDITGISSYDDAAAAYDQWNRSGNTYPAAGEALDMFGAVPALGKLGNIRYLSGSNIHKGVELGKNLIYKNIPWQEILNKADALQDSYKDNFAQGGANNANNANNMKRYYAAGGVDPSSPLNVRYNNPGNLRPPTMKNANDWWGEGAVTSIDSGNGFAIFSSPEEGLKALKQQLTLDGIKKGMTIKELIYKFAPPDDNNPSDAYAANMANALGLKVDDKISKNQIDDFAAAVIFQEGGPSALDSYKNFLPESSVSNARLSFGVDKTGDNIAAALGKPTSEDINADLFGGFESAEAQQAATDAYYANRNQTGIINSNIQQTPENFQTQGTPEDEARWYAENTNQEGIINQIANDFAASQAANQLGAPYEPTAEDYARLGINSNAIARQVADDFLNIPEGNIPESDFVDPRFLPQAPHDGIDKEEPFTVDDFNLGVVTDAETDAAYNRARQKEFIENPSGNYNNPDVRPKTEDPVKRNMLSKLKGQDYMGLLSDIGAYAARMAPLSTALAESGSYDTVRYPRFSPALPTAYTQKRDVGTAFNTARQAAMQQGKLDLGALSALATQQAQTIAGVEENVANERIGLLNQAQQLNNQVTMQEMADTAANKGAAATMKYQALAAMSEMGQGSLREANMRRNDQIVKQMFSNVFGDEFA
jgi:hypothetical protein